MMIFGSHDFQFQRLNFFLLQIQHHDQKVHQVLGNERHLAHRREDPVSYLRKKVTTRDVFSFHRGFTYAVLR